MPPAASSLSFTCSSAPRTIGSKAGDADVAHQVVDLKTELERIREAFGSGVLNPDGSLDRAALRQLIFADATARAQLEAILHPDIRQRMRETAAQTDAPYCVFSIPLLIETGRTKEFDRVLVVESVQGKTALIRNGDGFAE